MSSPSLTRRSFLATAGAGGLVLLTRGFGQTAEILPVATSAHPFRIAGGQLIVPAGIYPAAGKEVRVAEDRVLSVRPSDVLHVDGEETQLSAQKPQGFYIGTMLRGPKTSSIAAFNSLLPETLVVRDGAGKLLVLGEDYLLSAPFALIGIGPTARVTPSDKVYASYDHYTQRVDSVVVDTAGRASLIQGASRLVSPKMPEIPDGTVVIANVYRPFRARELTEAHLFPIQIGAAQAETVTKGGLIPRTMQKIQSRQRVKVVCWGDSITVGADVQPEDSWASRLRTELAARFPQTHFEHANHSIGGTKTVQWLANGDYPGLPKQNPEKCRFDLVLAEKPDLVVMEFLNDIVLSEQELERTYATIHEEFGRRGIEWIIVTPSLKIPETFDLRVMKDESLRLLDRFLLRFASAHGYAVADASARWRHLHREGVPFFALFNNGYNHPNAFGHGLFIEEIIKCFQT